MRKIVGNPPCWYVLCMDCVHFGDLATLKEAIGGATALKLDGRKHPTVKKLDLDFYQYTGPGGHGTLFIGTSEALLRHGFAEQLSAWEAMEEEYRMKNSEHEKPSTAQKDNEVLCYIHADYVDKDCAVLVGVDAGTGNELWMCDSCAQEDSD